LQFVEEEKASQIVTKKEAEKVKLAQLITAHCKARIFNTAKIGTEDKMSTEKRPCRQSYLEKGGLMSVSKIEMRVDSRNR